jgi:sarcosine oxidase subunit beta
MNYSVFNLIRQSLGGHKGWPRAWRDAEPKERYDAVVVGGGGHGLATAYYLAKEHGIRNVAVLERSYIGSGNVGRNTTIVRSNYMLREELPFYEWSLKLWEGLSRDLNYNVMFSQRGVLNLLHSDGEVDGAVRRGNAMIVHGADAEVISRAEVMKLVPAIDPDNARYPVYGGLLQRRAGNARHDAVAWGYARAADRLGVDIIQNCEVTGIRRDERGRAIGVDTTRGHIAADKIGLAVAGHSGQLAEMAGLRIPIETHKLQAYVTEGIKPVLDVVVTFGPGHFYISQSDKGGLVFGAMLDGYNSYAQRGNLPNVENTIEAGVHMMPCLSRLRLLRHWAGVMDMSMDGSPFICKTPVDGLYLNAGWNYGGFKATPASGWCFAHTIARDEPHPYNQYYTLDRFARGRAIDSKAVGPTPNLH